LVANLRLVAVLIFIGPAAEEDAAVEVFAVANAIQLQAEVAELLLGLQIAGAILDVDGAVDDGELGFLVGKHLPAAEILAVKERMLRLWTEFDIAKGDLCIGGNHKGESSALLFRDAQENFHARRSGGSNIASKRHFLRNLAFLKAKILVAPRGILGISRQPALPAAKHQ